MHRVELKDLFHNGTLDIRTKFLMHRVELKAQERRHDALGYLVFLMHRVELKVTVEKSITVEKTRS